MKGNFESYFQSTKGKMLSRSADKSQIPVAACFQIFSYTSLCKKEHSCHGNWQFVMPRRQDDQHSADLWMRLVYPARTSHSYSCFTPLLLMCRERLLMTPQPQWFVILIPVKQCVDLEANAFSVVVPAHDYCTFVVLISAFCSCQCFGPFCYVLNCLGGIFPPWLLTWETLAFSLLYL